ncbi:MAG: hypothetical protein ACRDD4_11385 [Culicoidibacterales bacterium]
MVTKESLVVSANTIEEFVEDSNGYYIDPKLVGTDINVEEIATISRSSTYEKLTLLSTRRFNYGPSGSLNPYNFGEARSFDRAIRSHFCWTGIGDHPDYRNVSIGFGFNFVSIAFSRQSSSTANCNNVAPALRGKYTRIYNYSDITVKKYKVDVYDRYSGKYLRTTERSTSVTNGMQYVAQAA